MTKDGPHRSITRRQVLLSAGGLVIVVGAGAAAVAGHGGGAGSTAAPETSGSSIRPGKSSAPGRVLQASAFCGIYYDAPTIRLSGSSNAFNEFKPGLPIGATSWQVLDAHGASVASGTMSAADASLTVCTHGVWHGGSKAVPGHYTVVTNAGAKGVVTGNVVICPPTNLHIPRELQGLGAWLAVAPDRDLYSYQPGKVSDILSNLTADPYFMGVQDTERPRPVWLAPAPQARAPQRSPTPQEWGELATALVAAGHRGAYYECPTNEPENGGWTLSTLVSYWNQCRDSILKADPSAHVMGFDSAGVMASSSLSEMAQFLDACPVDAFTDHLENSRQNLSNIVALRQLFGAMKTQFVKSGRPDLELWLTETGINGGLYGVLQPRRDARQRTVLRMVLESFGWPKEHSYDFRVFDAHGSGITTFMVDGQFGNSTGNLRAGAYALHVMSEALHGTVCTPQHPPRTLRFGSKGSVGDSLFAGLHYTGSDRDVVVLAANGMEKSSVDLSVSASKEVVVWDGMGVASTAPVTNGRVRIDLDDLPTYVFLPSRSEVAVAPAWWSHLTDITRGKKIATDSRPVDGSAAVLTSGTFGANLQGGMVPVPSKPYVTTTVPAKFQVKTTKAARGFALFTGGPAWQTAGCSLIAFEIAVNGKTVYSYECDSARTLPIPSPSSGNSSDPCLYTTYWTAPFAWLEEVDIQAGTVTLNITKASFGGQPDELGATASGSKHPEGDQQAINLVAWQLLA